MIVGVLGEIHQLFPTEGDCRLLLEQLRWPDGCPRCAYCTSARCTATETGRHHCNNCNTTFSVTVGTVMHRTRIDLRVWFAAVAILGVDESISARSLGTALGINKNTAWRMTDRILASTGRARDLRLVLLDHLNERLTYERSA